MKPMIQTKIDEINEEAQLLDDFQEPKTYEQAITFMTSVVTVYSKLLQVIKEAQAQEVPFELFEDALFLVKEEAHDSD